MKRHCQHRLTLTRRRGCLKDGQASIVCESLIFLVSQKLFGGFSSNQIKSNQTFKIPNRDPVLIPGGRGEAEDGDESRRRAGRGTEEHSATCHVHDDAVFADRSVPTSISDAASEAFAPGVTQVTQVDRSLSTISSSCRAPPLPLTQPAPRVRHVNGRGWGWGRSSRRRQQRAHAHNVAPSMMPCSLPRSGIFA